MTISLTATLAFADNPPVAELIECRRIWDRAPHNAFTDLVRLKNRWFCAFREADGHGTLDGALRVITSADGGKWESAALIRLTLKDLGTRIGCPNMVQLPDDRWVAAVRLYDKRIRTALCWLDPHAGKLTEFLTLPSGGDRSYAGLVCHEGLLWVSYYSSHEGKTSIYLAKVKFRRED